MSVKFGTQNLNEVIYKRMIRRILYEYLRTGRRVKGFMKKWDIEIYDTYDADQDFFTHVLSTSGGKINVGIPSGHTGKYSITFFLHDHKKTDIRRMMENSDRVQHELMHALLYAKYGTREKIFVKSVHDAEFANFKFKINFWYFRAFLRWTRIPIAIADIRRDYNNG